MKDNVRNFFYSKNRNSKSVRKNCFWFEFQNKKYLVSYQIIVCSIDENGIFEKYWDGYSVTTLNQINRFIELFPSIRYNGFNKKEWMELKTEYCDIEVYDYIQKYIPYIEWNDRNDYVAKIIYD